MRFESNAIDKATTAEMLAFTGTETKEGLARLLDHLQKCRVVYTWRYWPWDEWDVIFEPW